MAGTRYRGIDVLDQTLLYIRNNLSNLSSDRVVMENKVERLICEIQIVASDIYSCKESQQKFQGSSLHMVRSLTSPPSQTTNLIDNSDDHKTQTHGLSQTSHKYSRSTITLASESNFTTSSQFSRERSSSFSSSTMFKSQRCNSVEESGNHTTIIHEFPESPTFHSRSVPDYVHCSNASSKVYPTSHGSKVTNNQRERYYSGSPLSNRYTSMITSMPSMSQSFSEDGEESYHTHPIIITSTWIPEEQVDGNISTYQPHGVYTEKSSQQSSTSIRRSSSTRQPEHYQTHYQGQQMEMTPHGVQTESLSHQSHTSIRRTSSTRQQERYKTLYQGQQMEMTPHGVHTESLSQQSSTSIRRSSLMRQQEERYQTLYQGQQMEMTPHGFHTESSSQKSTSIRRSSSTRQPEHYPTSYQSQEMEHGINTQDSSKKNTSIRRSSSTRQTNFQGQRMEMTPHRVNTESSSQKSNSQIRNLQPEHYRTRYHVLQVDTTEEKLQCKEDCNKNDTSFRVLNQGRRSIKRKLSQLDPALLVETTV